MIFIFGTRGTTGNPIPSNQPCPACGKEHSIVMVPQQRYFHVFWIPIFPTGKSFTPVCSECTGVFTNQKLPVTEDVRQQYKTPKWTFAGLFLIIGLSIAVTISGIISSSAKAKEMSSKIESPQASDVYMIKVKPNRYSVMRVASFSNDSIRFNRSSASIPKKSKLKTLVGMSLYNESETEAYSKKDLTDNKLQEIEVLDIVR